MGFSFRRSKKIGPFRINVSKSGIGVSAGVKGFRVSKGPKGTQIRAETGGVYYRKTLSSSKDEPAREVQPAVHNHPQDARASSTDTAGVARAVIIMLGVILLVLVLITLLT